MHYQLRTLLILLAIGPPVLATCWLEWHRSQTIEAFGAGGGLRPKVQATAS
jgi:hypothetical protein